MKHSPVNNSSLDSLLESYYEEFLELYPLTATAIGDDRYNDTLPNNLTLEYRNLVKSFYTKYKNQLAAYDKANLNDTQRTSYDVLLWECEISLEGLKYPFYLTPIDQFWSMNLSVGQMAGGKGIQPFKTVNDYYNWLKRVDDYLVWCDTAIVNMKSGISKGYVLPKKLIIKIIPQMAQFMQGPLESHVFYSPVKNMPDGFSLSEKENIEKLYSQMVNEKVIPKYKELYQFFKNEYLPAGRESSGILDLPRSEGIYQYLIKYNTTTNMTADEVFELGKQEVDRITKEMEKIKDSVGFKGDLKEFFDYVRIKKELIPFAEAQQVIDYYNSIHEKIKPNLALLFDKVPQTAFEVRRTETFREKTASAEYNPGSIDGSRPGIFYVPVPDATKFNIFTGEDLFLHEAIPGHHYQISLQQENKELPRFRQLLWNSAFGEGWALYCESLGKELGLYKDPYQYFGMLSNEMHRAIRLVVDVGIHAKGWSREEAIQYSLDHEAESEESIVAEVERYMAIPGQALSYKIGQLKILELRAKAEKELGNKFDIKQFHNQLLDTGCLPLFMVEEKIEKWIEQVKKEKSAYMN